MRATERFVTTRAILGAIRGRETDLIDALKIPWRDGKPHINCPHRDHTDGNPSWRWDAGKHKAFCTCGVRDALGVLMDVEGIEFDAAKVRAAELLKRSDLIRERRGERLRGNGAIPAGCRLADYAAAKALPEDFLRSLGLADSTYAGAPAIKIPYRTMDGTEIAIRYRVALDGAVDRFRWAKGTKAALYGLDRLSEAREAGYVIIVEGESDCQTLWGHNFPALGLPGAANWNEDRDAPLFEGLPVVYIVIEPDKGGAAVMKWLERSAIAPRVKLVRLNGAKDPNALHVRDPEGFSAAFQHALDDAEPYQAETEAVAAGETTGNGIDADAEILRLAGLSTLNYGRERKPAADKLELPLSWLDKLVKEKKVELAAAETVKEGSEGGQGRPINLPEPEPWPQPVDGAALLTDITQAIERYMVMEPGAAECVALWAVHTHAIEAFGITPRLAITSPRPQCGKTTLLDIIHRLVLRPLLAANLSAASVFRVVEVARPTLLVDEADTFLPNNDELRGVLNSGHRHGGNVIRVVGEQMEPREFSTFAPAAIAMIGRLPGTLADRSISIALKRKRADEPVESFRYDRTQDLDRLGRMCARWAQDNIERLRHADPAVPASLYNRAADNWRGLLAIADLAGGEWPGRARVIAAAVVNNDDAKRVGLLADIRDIFKEKRVDRIRSADLAAALVAIEGHPWAELGKARKPLSANGLARMLASDHVIPKTIRFGVGPEDTAKGYELEQFADAFVRYLPPTPNPTVTPSQPKDFCGFEPDTQPSQADQVLRLENAENPSVSASCDGVTVEKGGEPPKGERKRFTI